MKDEPPLLLDVTRLIWRRWKGRLPTGIDRVCLAYLRRFAPDAQAVVQRDGFRRILKQSASQELFRLLDEPKRSFKSRFVLGALKHFGQTSDRGRGRFYLNVGHTGLNSAGFQHWVGGAGVRPIYLVHDLIPITHPQFCRAGEADKHRERMRTILATAAGVIGNSEATLDELRAFGRAENLPKPPMLVAPLGVDPLPRRLESAQSERPTFVTIGTIEGRKNHLLLLDVWSRLIDRLGDATPKLIIIGQRGWAAEAVFDLLDRNEKLRRHVVEMNNCSDEELARHVSSARAVLFPSQAEGYGLPLVEAFGLGVPVIASDLPAFREIGGDMPTYLDPRDSTLWEAAILEYARADSPAREEQLRRIKSFSLPDWGDHFTTVERWLDALGAAAEPSKHRLDKRLYG